MALSLKEAFMIHNFDAEIAQKYGLLESVLLNHIYYWIEKNRANESNFYEGTYWTYNSTRAFNELFPYASERQIKNALKHLREEGILLTGNYNKSAYDRTLWYALSKKGLSIVQKCPMEEPNQDNGLGNNVPPIPDNIPDNKPNKEPDTISGPEEQITEPEPNATAVITLQCNINATDCSKGKEIEERKENIVCTEQAAAQNVEPEPEPIITLPLNTGEEFPIYQTDLDEFFVLYPAVDILQAMRGMRGWCITNPTKRKTKRGIRRFINSWLAREQDKGGSTGYSRGTTQNPGSSFEQFADKARRWAEIE